MMSPEIKHRDTEYKVKRHLCDQYLSHRTHIDDYEPFQGVVYEQEVFRLAKYILTYQYNSKGEKGLREYVSTNTLDWQ